MTVCSDDDDEEEEEEEEVVGEENTQLLMEWEFGLPDIINKLYSIKSIWNYNLDFNFC